MQNLELLMPEYGIRIEMATTSSNLSQIFIFELRPFKVDGENGFIVVDQSCDDRNNTFDVALLGNGRCALRPKGQFHQCYTDSFCTCSLTPIGVLSNFRIEIFENASQRHFK